MIGYAFCGSFCTIAKSMKILRELAAEGNDIQPIVSENVYSTDTRFGKAKDIIAEMESLPWSQPISPSTSPTISSNIEESLLSNFITIIYPKSHVISWFY